jgi:hypothetical protein
LKYGISEEFALDNLRAGKCGNKILSFSDLNEIKYIIKYKKNYPIINYKPHKFSYE